MPVTIEEIEDEELIAQREKPKSLRLLLESLDEEDDMSNQHLERINQHIHIPIFMETMAGEIVESEVEAYIVPKMMVPILLGENYQLNYEVGLTRNVVMGTKINFAGTMHKISAMRVDRTPDFNSMRQSSLLVSKYAKAKTHQCNKTK